MTRYGDCKNVAARLSLSRDDSLAQNASDAFRRIRHAIGDTSREPRVARRSRTIRRSFVGPISVHGTREKPDCCVTGCSELLPARNLCPRMRSVRMEECSEQWRI